MLLKDINMAEEELKPKSMRDYIISPYEHHSKPLNRLAEGLVSLEKILLKISKEQKNTKVLIEDEEIKKIVGERYKELIDQELTQAIKGKGGVMPSLRKYLGFTTAGFFVVLALAGGFSFVYLKNKTTTGNIMNIENSINKIKSGNEKLSSDFKEYSEDNNGKIKNLEEQMNSKQQDYEKAINNLKTSNEEYKKELDELEKQNQNYDRRFDELENKVSGTEGRLNSLMKQKNSQER